MHISAPFSSPSQNCTTELSSICSELGGPKIAKIQGGCFVLGFFEGHSLSKIVVLKFIQTIIIILDIHI